MNKRKLWNQGPKKGELWVYFCKSKPRSKDASLLGQYGCCTKALQKRPFLWRGQRFFCLWTVPADLDGFQALVHHVVAVATDDKRYLWSLMLSWPLLLVGSYIMIGIGVQGYSFVQFLTIVIEGYPYGQVGFHQLIACCWSGERKDAHVHFFHWQGTFVTRGFLAKISQGLQMLILFIDVNCAWAAICRVVQMVTMITHC